MRELSEDEVWGGPEKRHSEDDIVTPIIKRAFRKLHRDLTRLGYNLDFNEVVINNTGSIFAPDYYVRAMEFEYGESLVARLFRFHYENSGNWSLREIARALRIAPMTLKKWFSHEAVPNMTNQSKIALFLNANE